MEVRIDHIHSGSAAVVHIAGRLSGTAVTELKKTCDPIKAPFVLDLSSLMFADDLGISTIRSIIDRGADVRGASPFIELLLDSTRDEVRAVRHQGKFIWS
jgi:anti-anti-sigma regulatory factor